MACSPLAVMSGGIGTGSFLTGGTKGRKVKAPKGQVVADPGAEPLVRALEDAVTECVRTGRLPAVVYPTPRVAVPTAKQSKALSITTRCVPL